MRLQPVFLLERPEKMSTDEAKTSLGYRLREKAERYQLEDAESTFRKIISHLEVAVSEGKRETIWDQQLDTTIVKLLRAEGARTSRFAIATTQNLVDTIHNIKLASSWMTKFLTKVTTTSGKAPNEKGFSQLKKRRLG